MPNRAGVVEEECLVLLDIRIRDYPFDVSYYRIFRIKHHILPSLEVIICSTIDSVK